MLFVVLLFLLVLTCSIYSQGLFAVVQPSADPTKAFEAMPNDYVLDKNIKGIDTQNIPKAHPQDGYPVCCSEAARTMYLQKICSHLKDPSVCSKLTDKQIPSVLSISAVAASGDAPHFDPKNPLPIDLTMFKPKGSHPEELSIQDLPFVVHQMEDAGSVAPESCYPVDLFMAKFHESTSSKNTDASLKVIKKVKDDFDKSRLEAQCDNCLNDIAYEIQNDLSVLNKVLDIKQIKDALLAKDLTFEQFIHSILIGKCADKAFTFKPYPLSPWPDQKSPGNAKTKKDILKQIGSILDSKSLVGVEVCQSEQPNGDVKNCTSGFHCLVITHSARACNSKGDCDDFVQVLNSWGDDWQAENHDGWVRAETLFKFADIGRSSQIFNFNDL